jgi:hypothetical protein
MVVLAGINAVVATHRDSKKVRVPGPETGRPETSREFASRMKNKFVLRGPKDGTEGGLGNGKRLTTPLTHHNIDQNDKENVDHQSNQEDVDPDDQSNQDQTPNIEHTLINVLKNDTGLDLLIEIKGHYQDDSTFKSILERPKDFRNFEVVDDLIYIKMNGRNLLCIPKLMIDGRQLYETIIAEAHSMLAHLGPNKTLNYLRDHVWWKDMVAHTKAFCETCITCKKSKPNNQKPYGLLNPLATPSEPWESIGVDFIGPLPLSSNRDGEFDSITVVICLLTAMTEIIPSRINYKAKDIAELMFENVYKHHGLPKTIVSDRDVLFTSTFWEHLNTLIGIKLKMSSAYHPQTDGATERANRTITQMLRQCIDPNQKDWVSKLPTIQFAINSARSESTGYAPFFLNNGRMPRAMVWNSANPTEYSNVREFAKKKKLALMSAHDSIIAARVKQTRDANRKRQMVPFKKGDFVYLSTKNISFEKGLARKLIPKYIGPYKILHDFNNQSFRLELPVHLKRRGVHDVFHSSLLRIHVPNDDRLFPGRMDTQIGGDPDSGDEWAVNKIKSHAGSGEESTFEILWKSGDVTWMPYYQIEHLQALEVYLELLEVDHISKLTTGKGKPPLDDPQVFLGALRINSLPSTSIPFLHPSTTIQISYPATDFTFPLTTQFQDLNDIFNSPESLRTFTRIFPLINMPEGINHPCFNRINDTEYAVLRQDHSNNTYRAVLHVGQVAKYLDFDRRLREGRKIYPKTERPFGYEEFALIFNSGVSSNDKRRLSTFTRTESGPFLIAKSERPVTLRNFKIRPEQCGLGTLEVSPAQTAVMTEMAISAAADKKRRREAYEEREKNRKTKRRYFDEEYHHSQDSEQDEEDFIPFHIDLPRISSNRQPSEPTSSITVNLPVPSTSSSAADPVPSSSSTQSIAPEKEQRKQPARKSVRNSSGGKQPQPAPQPAPQPQIQELDELLQPPVLMEL